MAAFDFPCLCSSLFAASRSWVDCGWKLETTPPPVLLCKPCSRDADKRSCWENFLLVVSLGALPIAGQAWHSLHFGNKMRVLVWWGGKKKYLGSYFLAQFSKSPFLFLTKQMQRFWFTLEGHTLRKADNSIWKLEETGCRNALVLFATLAFAWFGRARL